MSSRKKLVLSLSALFLTVVVGIVSVVGVLALLNTEFEFGGSIRFTATNVHATVSQAVINDGAISTNGKMPQITYDANNDDVNGVGADDWSGLDLQFPEDGEDVVIKFTVTNHSTSDKLRLIIGKPTGTAVNATIEVEITEGRDGASALAMGTDEIYTTSVINTAVEGTPNTEYSAEVVVTFHIQDKNKDASITDFNIPITLEKVNGYIITLTIPEGVEYLEGNISKNWDNCRYGISFSTNLGSSITMEGFQTCTIIGETLSCYTSGPIVMTDSDGNEQVLNIGEQLEITKDIQFVIRSISNDPNS